MALHVHVDLFVCMAHVYCVYMHICVHTCVSIVCVLQHVCADHVFQSSLVRTSSGHLDGSSNTCWTARTPGCPLSVWGSPHFPWGVAPAHSVSDRQWQVARAGRIESPWEALGTGDRWEQLLGPGHGCWGWGGHWGRGVLAGNGV